MPMRDALSAYAGPMPRRVVPIWRLPRRRSDAWSIAMCHGMIRCAFPETTTTDVSMPRASSSSSSAISTSGSTTQPAPITDTLPRDHAARRLADLERLVADDDRVPGVRPALVAADEIGTLREQVDDLALALVSPLRADDDGRGHRAAVCLRGARLARLQLRPAALNSTGTMIHARPTGSSFSWSIGSSAPRSRSPCSVAGVRSRSPSGAEFASTRVPKFGP